MTQWVSKSHARNVASSKSARPATLIRRTALDAILTAEDAEATERRLKPISHGRAGIHQMVLLGAPFNQEAPTTRSVSSAITKRSDAVCKALFEHGRATSASTTALKEANARNTNDRRFEDEPRPLERETAPPMRFELQVGSTQISRQMPPSARAALRSRRLLPADARKAEQALATESAT